MAGALFFSNFALRFEGGYFDISADRKPLLHLWSLSIEEQFYLLWPILLTLAYKVGWRFRRMTLVLGGCSLALSVYLTCFDRTAAFYNPAARFWELLIGSALGVFAVHSRYRAPSRPVSALMSLTGVVGILLTSLALTRESAFPGILASVPCMCAILILVSDPKNPVSRGVLSNPVMVMVGLISYPLYLWHWPLWSLTYIYFHGQVPEIARGTLFGAGFFLAYATYVLVEKPLRFGGERQQEGPCAVEWNASCCWYRVRFMAK